MTSTFIDPSLVNEVLRLKQGDHLCLIYESDPAEQLHVLLPFIRQGLEHGEQCVYIADDQTVEDLRNALVAYGIDVEDALGRNALLLWTRSEWRQPGELDSIRQAEQVAALVQAALDAGFEGIRFGVEMTWTLGPDIDLERLRHWEATINTIFTPETRGRIICQYSRGRLSPGTIHAALRTHPVAVIGSEICANPYYEAPLVLDGTAVYATAEFEPARIDWMLSQLGWVRALEKEHEERIRAEATAEGLRQAGVVKDQFIGLVSHELKSPLATVIGNGRLLQTRGSVLTEEQREQALGDMVSQAQKLQRIIENLILLASMEAPNSINLAPVSLSVLVADSVSEFRKRNPDRHIAFSASDDVPLAHAEEALLSEVLENLLSNAHKYSPLDAPIEIILRTNPEGNPEICVRDYGCGIDGDECEKIFEAFYRSAKTKDLAQGIGLGLAVCRRILEAQGGRVWVTSRPDGCDFNISLLRVN